MKTLLFILFIIGCLSSPSFAMWAFVPLDVLVQDTDLIIIGNLGSVSEYSNDGMDYAQGTIIVDEVIWGDVAPGESLTLKWENASGVVCPRVEHKYNENKQGIWLLTIENGREVRADYPGRYVEPNERRKVEILLREKKVCLRTSRYAVYPTEPIGFSVIFRNATQNQLQFPGLEYQDGYLYLSPEIELVLKTGWGEHVKEASPLPNRVVVSDNIAPILVGPGQEYKVNINVRELFDIVANENYSVQFKVKGHSPGNEARFYQQVRDSPKKGDALDNEKVPTGVHNSKAKMALGSAIGLVGLSIFLVLYRLRVKN